MQFPRLFLLISIFLLGSISTSSYANLVYKNATSVETSYPVDKKKTVKKKKKRLRKKMRKRAFFRAPDKVNKTQAAGVAIAISVLILLLLVPVILFIIGGLTGGLGWFIAGAILMGIWLVFGYILIFIRSAPFPFLGLVICLFFLLACLAFFFWALIAALPFLLTLSIIFGSIVILGLLVAFLASIL
jgi:hypothetical protein